MLRLYMDENVHGSITIQLRRRQVDVITAQEDGHDHTPDPIVLDRAMELERVLFTCDDDLLKEANQRWERGESFCGVIFTKQRTLDIGLCVRDLELMAKVNSLEDHKNKVEYIPLT